MPRILVHIARGFHQQSSALALSRYLRCGVCLSAALILTLCSGCERVSSATLRVSRSFGTQGVGPGQFVEPRAIAASPDGKIFVIDRTGRVQRFSSSGQFEHVWEMPDNAATQGKPSGMCVDYLGRVFVADTHQHRVVVFDREGNELFRFGELGMGPGQFMLPTDVAVDSQGFIYVSEYGGNDRISKFDADAKYQFSFGDLMSGSAMLQRPSGLAVDEQDNVWVADSSNHRICCFNPQGELIASIGQLGTEPGQLRYPRDVVVLPEGRLVVVESANNRLTFLGPDGYVETILGGPGRSLGEYDRPLNATLIGDCVGVTDSGNHRVQLCPFNPSSTSGTWAAKRWHRPNPQEDRA